MELVAFVEEVGFLVDDDHEDFSDEEEIDDSDESGDDDDDESGDDDDEYDESIFERIIALRDIIPAETRESISNNISTVLRFGARSAKFLGNTFWVVTTSALLLIMPLAFEIERENFLTQMEADQVI
ncbi:13936_t:CDS:2 [Entrophospora sp. SA101]|nr:14329_t:CDS:2 [Entrophospora sp. SA101]CAJ0925589.1 13936_t:CDS:2 [Entrophospora sp. SA101]